MEKRERKRLQKAVNHINKTLYRLEQLRDVVPSDTLRLASLIRGDLLTVGEQHGVKLKRKGLPR